MMGLRIGHPVQLLFGPVGQDEIRPKTGLGQTKVLQRLSDEWANRTFSTRFIIVSTVVVLTTMLHLGAWMDGRIRQSSVDAAANAAARYMELTLQDHLQSLERQPELLPEAYAAIKKVLKDSALGRPILELKIWRADRTLAFAAHNRNAAEIHAPKIQLMTALTGKVSAKFEDDLAGTDDVAPTPAFEVYVPIRSKQTQKIIGVTEFYEDATALKSDFTIARQQSWIVIGSLTLLIIAVLFGIVHRGSLLILRQANSLETQLYETSRLLQQNQSLQSRLIEAQRQTHEHSDQFLRRIGADLHDGPAQLLSVALLRLDEIEPQNNPGNIRPHNTDEAFSTIRSATANALQEIRNISTGLSLPQLDHLTVQQTVLRAVADHQRLTKTGVTVVADDLPLDAQLAIKTCIYRCIQEGLSNAYRHGGGIDQNVAASFESDRLKICVSDKGAGFEPATVPVREGALGLAGLRHRVESLGGTFKLIAAPGDGTSIFCFIPLKGHCVKVA